MSLRALVRTLLMLAGAGEVGLKKNQERYKKERDRSKETKRAR